MYLVFQTKHPGNDAGLAEYVYSLGIAHTHMLDNTNTFCAIPSRRASGYEPGDALLVSESDINRSKPSSTISSNPPALYTQTLSLSKAITKNWNIGTS
jgi:hypothetical protein